MSSFPQTLSPDQFRRAAAIIKSRAPDRLPIRCDCGFEAPARVLWFRCPVCGGRLKEIANG